MSLLSLKEPKKREKAVEKLLSAMNNGGNFSVLLLGAPGTGKTHWINWCSEQEQLQKFNAVHEISSGLAEDSLEFWNEELKKADKKVMVIDEIEKLSHKSQELLFKALSTKDGKFGFGEKNLDFLPVFTSCISIENLQKDRRILLSKFFDRISQFVIELPDFNTTDREIFNDFTKTWSKMNFENKLPDLDDFKTWLNENAHRMHGNFRDLDKIAINWNLHKIGNKEDDKILKEVKNDFEKYLHHPNLSSTDINTFVFDEDSNYEQLLNDFRAKLKSWSMAINNGNIREAAKMLGISHRTMHRW